MIFDNLPDDLQGEELVEFAVMRFRELRSKIFSHLPEECPLKSRNVLSKDMFLVLDIETVPSQEGICSLCPETTCPYNPNYKFKNLLPN